MSESKSWYKRWWAIVLYVLVGIVIISYFLPDSNNQQQTVCDKPYILVGTSCCLDNNDNSICDTDEKSQETNTQSGTIISPSSYQTCIKEIFKNECEKYGLVYTDYSSAVQFITCTDDGVYSMDDIGEDSKYLQVYTPTRILEIKCGTYTEPTNSKLKCEDDFFKEQCENERLIYTDWSAAVGFITCTDDGIYTLNEIGEDTKYKQVYVSAEFVDSKC